MQNARERIYASEIAFLCANDLDAVAALYIEHLEDPLLRGDALMTLQTFKETPDRGVFGAKLQERFYRARDREDVQDALAKVGRVLDVPLY